MSSDAIYQLVGHILQTNYEDIPDEDREVTKKHFLDTVGSVIAGSTASGCDMVVDLVKSCGGIEESTIAAYGGKVPGSNAVWANTTMGRSREIDNYDMITGEHASVSAVPAEPVQGQCAPYADGRRPRPTGHQPHRAEERHL